MKVKLGALKCSLLKAGLSDLPSPTRKPPTEQMRQALLSRNVGALGMQVGTDSPHGHCAVDSQGQGAPASPLVGITQAPHALGSGHKMLTIRDDAGLSCVACEHDVPGGGRQPPVLGLPPDPTKLGREGPCSIPATRPQGSPGKLTFPVSNIA